MHRAFAAGLLALIVALVPAPGLAQRPGPRPPAAPAAPAPPPAPAPSAAGDTAEIKLDENVSLKAAAVEAKMRAILSDIGLLQRQFQDLQREWARLLEERTKLIEDAGKRASVEVKDPNEWALDEKGQRYLRSRRVAPTPSR